MKIIKPVTITMALLLAVFTANANASLIRLDFTGSVYSAYSFDINGMATQLPSYLGQSVSGSMVIQTDGLTRTTQDSPQFSALYFTNDSSTPDLITSSLVIGGLGYDIESYSEHSGGIQYIDSHGPLSCGSGCSMMTPDQMSISDRSSEPLQYASDSSVIPGSYNSRNLSINSADQIDPLVPGSGMNYIDLTQNLDASDILTIPLKTDVFRGVTGTYGEDITTCTVAFYCVQSSNLSLAFDITSISRTEVSAAPLPNSLSMLLMGIGFILFVRTKPTSHFDQIPV